MASFHTCYATLNRHQRRRIAATAPAVERVTDADAAFFARFPHRSHRLRLMAIAEFEQMLAAGGEDTSQPGERWAVAVRQVAPGARMRRFFTTRRGEDLDLAEAACVQVWATLTEGSDLATHVEGQLRKIIDEGDGE